MSPSGVLASVLIGLVGSGFQLGLMPLASLSVSRDLRGSAYAPGRAGDWFARYTAALVLGAAFGGMLFGALGDRWGRALLSPPLLRVLLIGSPSAPFR